MKAFLIFFTIILIFCAFDFASGQFSENFNDGDFADAPSWHGDSSAFEIINGMLHLKAGPEAGTAMMTTNSYVVPGSQWTFELQMDFNPSSQNYADVYIVSDSKDLHAPLNGYFVRIGYTADNVSLYRQEGDRTTAKKIIGGVEHRLDKSRVHIRVRVTRDGPGNWQLFSDPEMIGNFIIEGTATERLFTGSKYFGMFCKYTSTRADKFYFDNFTVAGQPPADTIPPLIDSVRQISANSLMIYFSEAVISYPAGMPENYRIDHNGNLWSPAIAVRIIGKTALVIFQNDFVKDENYDLTIERLADSCLNSTYLQTRSFAARNFSPLNYREVVINEIMADPYPVVGLPDDEYVELFNASQKTVNLAGWQLTGAGNDRLPDYLLPPGGFVILTEIASTVHFSVPVLPWGNSGSLLNDGEWLALRDPSGHTIDSLKYEISWYKDPSHKNGGWSLEQINPYSSCSGPDNWKASIDISGGSPGKKNSVFADIADPNPPVLTGIKIIDSLTAVVTFSEMPFNFSETCFHLTSGPFVDTVSAGPDYNQLQVFFQSPFKDGKTYNLEVNDITDCTGNVIIPVSEAFCFDTSPPVVQSVLPLTRNKLKVRFNEKIDSKLACHISNYKISPGEIQPENVKMADEYSVYLTFHKLLEKGVYTISCTGIDDITGNTLVNGMFPFEFRLLPQPGFNDVVISEIMADPTPVRDLPPCEYLEFYNVSGREICMADAVLQVGRKLHTVTELHLEKDGYALLCAHSCSQYLDSGIPVVGLSNWPAIKNRGDTIALYRNDGKLVFAIAYDENWYQSIDKKKGGWSLEMIDVKRGCAGKDNWKASTDPAGGTPGRENSVHWPKPDLKGPELLLAGAVDPLTVILKFSERLHPEKTDGLIIKTEPALNIAAMQPLMPLCDKIRLSLNDTLQPGTTYTVKVDNATDCCGNINGKINLTATFVLPALPEVGDIIINEILFHPRPGGVEFVELYNRSDKSFNLQHLTVAVEKEGVYQRKKVISPEFHIYKPGEFLVLTKNPSTLKGDYPAGNAETFFPMPLPRLNNEEGTIVLLRDDGRIIDRVNYCEHFHHPLIINTAGVSLERISTDIQKGNEMLWHSAASAAGYATPGKMNSQYMPGGIAEENITIEPRIIAPNAPGIPDFLTIGFSFSEYGMMGTIEVYDVQGRKIKTIANNELLAISGFYIWRGDDDTGQGVRTGQYIIRFELYNPNGRQQIIRKTISVGRNF